MKTFILLFFVTIFSFNVKAEILKTEAMNSELSVLVDVQKILFTSHPETFLDAKIVEMLLGEEMNPERMVLILGNGMAQEAKIFKLQTPIRSVQKFTYINKETLQIKVLQDSINKDGDNIVTHKTLTVKFKLDQNGNIGNEIEVK